MRVGALRLVRAGLEPVAFVGARGEAREPPETLSAAERRWWPLTDLPMVDGSVIGVSTGWATFGAHRLPEDAVEQADRRMYAHKRSKGARE